MVAQDGRLFLMETQGCRLPYVRAGRLWPISRTTAVGEKGGETPGLRQAVERGSQRSEARSGSRERTWGRRGTVAKVEQGDKGASHETIRQERNMGNGFPITRVRKGAGGVTATTEEAHVGFAFAFHVHSDDPAAPLSEAHVSIRPVPVLVVSP